MAKFTNSPARGGDNARTGGGQTNGGKEHVEATRLMGECLDSNSSTRPEAVVYPQQETYNR